MNPFDRQVSRRILAVAPVSNYHGFNTSEHRIKALRALGHDVTVLDTIPFLRVHGVRRFSRRVTNRLYRLGLSVPISGGDALRRALLDLSEEHAWDWLWLEKSLDIGAADIRRIRLSNPGLRVIGFSPDDMGGRHNRSAQFVSALRECDLYLTTKTYNVTELESMGCENVKFIGNGYDPAEFRPEQVTELDRKELGGDVGFIGTWERDRAAHLVHLAKAGLSVRVWGGPWHNCPSDSDNLRLEHKPLFFDKFRKACGAFKINLNFLRKLNRDLQTTRSVEIPACGGFMLAERTDEHQGLFREGAEADYFSSREEMIEKCRYYLQHDETRRKIARAGYERCLSAGYSNQERLRQGLSHLP